MVAIAIIGVLAGSLLVVLNPGAQIAKARDAQRKSDLKQIQNALELYYQDNGKYPDSVDGKIADSNGNAVNWGDPWQPYMGNLPKDPNSDSKTYVYNSTPNKQAYYLYATLDREGSDPQACNSGNVCTSLIDNGGTQDACGSGGICNYGVSSPNVIVSEQTSPVGGASTPPLPTPTSPPPPISSTPTPFPTSTPTPTPTVYTATFYPSVDGTVLEEQPPGMDWTTIRGAAGTNSDDSSNSFRVGSFMWSDGTWAHLWRAIFVFDTSELPDTAIISAATLSLLGGGMSIAGFFEDAGINIYSSSPDSITNLASGDYDSLGSTAYATAIGYQYWLTSVYNNFSLNSDGIANISKTSESKFGARESYDASGITPPWGRVVPTGFYIAIMSEESNGNTWAPKLVVTYSTP